MKSKGLLSLTPLLVFIGVYFISSLSAKDFYGVPVSSAFLIACIYAVAIGSGPIKDRLAVFSRGAGHPNVLLMIWIFILAGAFAGTAKAIGSVDATVAATLSIVPPKMLYAGLFITACFISMAIGTSVGTIVALVPLAAGIAAQTGSSVPYMAAIITGGAFFGDNLSFISDTTIASTRAAGCEMSDKFKVNIRIILPAVIIVSAIYIIQGQHLDIAAAHESFELYKTIPYVLIIILAIAGVDVCLTLAIGILVNCIIGLACGKFGWVGFLSSAGTGISGMSDLIIVTLLAGGLLEMIRAEGGLDLMIKWLSGMMHGKRGAQAGIAVLVSLANLFTANNTIAIITVGGIAKDVSDRFGISPRKTASILDTFSCLVQGMIPYGAQLLMAAGLAGISPTQIIPFLYYPVIMGACAILAIIFDYPKY